MKDEKPQFTIEIYENKTKHLINPAKDDWMTDNKHLMDHCRKIIKHLLNRILIETFSPVPQKSKRKQPHLCK